MKNLIGILCFLVLASCTSDPVNLAEESFYHEKYKKYEFDIADDAKLIIRSNDIDEATIESIKEEFTMSHLGIVKHGAVKIEKRSPHWEDGLFLQVPKTRGSYYWKDVDISKVTYQTYAIETKRRGSSWRVYDVLQHKVTRKSGLIDYQLPPGLDKDEIVHGVKANLFGHHSDIYIKSNELLQSEIRCIDTPDCDYIMEGIIDYLYEFTLID